MTAARLWAKALESDTRLGDDRQTQHRYNASCAAALAGSGKGEDIPKPDDAAKAMLRKQAMDWLKAEAATWAKLAENAKPEGKEVITPTLNHWKQDTDLAGIRDSEVLAKLPVAEQAAWRALWGEVDALLAKTAKK